MTSHTPSDLKLINRLDACKLIGEALYAHRDLLREVASGRSTCHELGQRLFDELAALPRFSRMVLATALYNSYPSSSPVAAPERRPPTLAGETAKPVGHRGDLTLNGRPAS